MVLKGHENDLEFIETLLDEQKYKILKLPLSVFFKKSSLQSILDLLEKQNLAKVKREKKKQLTEKLTFDKIVTDKKEEMFLEHLKSKSGDNDFLKEKHKNEEKLQDEIFSDKFLEKRKTEEGLKEKMGKVFKYLEEEEHVGEVLRFFRSLVKRLKKGHFETLEDDLLKGFRKIRKLYSQGKLTLKRNKEKFVEIERLYTKSIESLHKVNRLEVTPKNQVDFNSKKTHLINLNIEKGNKVEEKKKEKKLDKLNLLKHLLKLQKVNPTHIIPNSDSIIYKIYLDKKMKNKFKKEEWENNIKFYQNLFNAESFKEFHDMVGDGRGTVEHFEGPKRDLGQGEYNLRKTSGDNLANQKVDLKEYSDINTIKRNVVAKTFDKGESEEIYQSVEFNSNTSAKSNMFDTNSSIGEFDNNAEPSSIETSKENDNIRQIIEQCIMEGEAKTMNSRPTSMESIEEEDPSTYDDPFNSNLKKDSPKKEPQQKKEGSYRTSFVKFRDVKFIQSYDFDTVESNIVWNPLKESVEPGKATNLPNNAFSLQNTCFDKIENKLIYAMTEAFRSNSKDIVDTDLLELIQAIFQNPGDRDVVLKFFKKGKYELEISKKYLWKFHVVCKNFLSLEQEGFLRRQKRFMKALSDFAIRKLVKDFEITVIKRVEKGGQELPKFQSGVSLASHSKMTTFSKVTSATKIETPLYSNFSMKNKSGTKGMKRSDSKNTFYLLRKESRNSRIRKHPLSYSMPSIYVQPLILKAFRSAVSDPKKDFQMISALNVNDYYSPKDFQDVPRYSEDDVFSALKKKKYVIFSVQNLLEMFEMIFDKQKQMFEMKVKTNMIEYFLKKRFEIVKSQMMGTFKELHLTSYFKEIYSLNDDSSHR